MKEHHKDHMKSKTKTRVKRLQNSPYAIAEGEPIGKGSFAVIKRAYNLDNIQEELAVKIISIQDEETAKTVKSELMILKELPHNPHLVNCMKVQISSERNFYIIMEYCNQGNLEKFIFDHKNDLHEERIWFFLKQFCQGYQVLYDRSIVHRDIKPENILIHNGNFKISDFGLAKAIQDVETIQNISSKGTPIYMAPELHFENEGSSKIDMFSLGVIVYRLAFRGKHPFFDNGRNYHSIYEYFKELELRKLMFPPKHNRSAELVGLIERMLTKDKQKRIGWKQLFGMERVKKAVRNERRKEIVTMEEFRKSLLVIPNPSIIDVKFIEEPKEEGAADSLTNPNHKEEGYLFIEEAFNKKEKSKLEKKLYCNKLLYTLIDIANSRILRVMQEDTSMHSYISKQLEAIVLLGMAFSLSMITNLEEVSGDWNGLSNGEMLNFEDIFENDREIIAQKLKAKGFDLETHQYIAGSYEERIYQLLTEYQEYPVELKKSIRVILAFLLDIYDMALKLHEGEIEQEDKDDLDFIQEAGVQKFQDYIYSLEQIKEQAIIKKLKRMGLYFQ